MLKINLQVKRNLLPDEAMYTRKLKHCSGGELNPSSFIREKGLFLPEVFFLLCEKGFRTYLIAM